MQTDGGEAAEKIVPADRYPGYLEYVAILQRLAATYPDRCALEDWGTLPSGHKIYTLRITDKLMASRGKPQVLMTGTMHGNETAGYWLLLELAETLLREPGDDLLRDLEIYINPLANPDGAFYHSDNSLARSRRGNANSVDLNRNYPDPDDGLHPDGNDYQPETLIFMRAAHEHSFDLAINLHGGAEVFNYPWDTYRNRHPDNTWWRRISREFAQRAQLASGSVSYFEDRQDGVTNGHDWYPISGSRQDYMNYYHRCREATLEVSNVKRYPARGLGQLWTYVRRPLYGFLEEARKGLHGFVRDAGSGEAIAARVTIPGHDYQNSDVIADARYGDYHRYLAAGTYEVEVSADGYVPQRHVVTIYDDWHTTLDVQLEAVVADAVEARRK